MKKYITIAYLIFLFLGMQPKAMAQEILGSWVISTTGNFNPDDPGTAQSTNLFRLDFTGSPIPASIHLSDNVDISDNLQMVSTSSEYNTDQSLACMAFSSNESIYFYNSYAQRKQTETLYHMNHTSRIVARPTNGSQYCAIYCGKGTTKNDHGQFYVTLINNPDDNLTIEPHNFDGKYYETTDFCLASELNGERMIYYASEINGLSRIGVEQVLNGTLISEVLIPNSNPEFAGHFNAQEMEVKQSGQLLHVIWTTAESSGDLYHYTYDLDNSSGYTHIYHVGEGIIAGVEFSTMDENIVYLSCENSGIVKYQLDNQQKTILSGSGNYNKSSLQTAPNDYIYAVKNSGDYLGYINQHNDLFTPEIFHFPFNTLSNPGYLANKRVFGEHTFFMLPKNEHPYIQPQATLDIKPESCPDVYDGEVWITVTGGAPPYTIVCDHPEVTFEWEEDDNWFHAEGLTTGTYEYTITDAAGNVIEGEFVIIPDYSGYTYIEEQYFDGSIPIPGNGDVVSFFKGFTIPAGANITFNNCTILMGPDAKIIIEHGQAEQGSYPGIAGGVLKLNHATITNHARCNDRWEGIEVRGLPDQSQLPGANGLVYQGQLLVMNQSEINNAWNAIATKQDGVYGEHGGIIKAENSYFRNNKRSVEILPYENFNPYGPDVRMRYNSWFKNCTFEWNNNYIPPMDMNTHVSIWNVWYIDFYGCKFQNNTTSEVNTGYGIYSVDGGCRFINYCSSTLQPCPENETERCEFKNLFTGIYASNTSFSNNRVYVNDADFENNSIGVYLSKVNYAAVLASRFHIGDNPVTKAHCADNSYGFGIDAHACMGFAFEDNTFDKAQAATTGFYTGIRVSDCPSEADVIYHNNFDGLSYGNYAYGNNRRDGNDNDKTGVIYECNQNTNNAVDFIVTHDLFPKEAMIHTHQGIPGLLASGNRFSDITGDNDWNFRNEGEQNINWYYCDVCPDETPVKYFHLGTDELPLFTPIVEPYNSCPSHYGGGVIKLTTSQKQQKEAEFAVSLSNYNNVKALYDNLKDGGNSTGELLDIQTATPDDMWALRSQLLGHSPHLSEEVLKEVADRTDVFPETAIFDILAANPDELDMEMLQYLEEKEVPLPDYLLSILYQVAGGTTYKTVLLQDMAYYHVEKTKAAQDIIRSILADTVVDQTDYRNWLDNMGGLEADKQIIESYLSENDISSASLLLSILPGIYALEDEQLVAYQDYTDLINLQINLMNENRTILDLTTQEQSNLLAITESSDAQNRATAKNILKFAYGYEEYECQYISDPSTMKAKEIGHFDTNHTFGMAILVTPNPAATWAHFTYTLPHDATDGILIISDITGKTLETMEVQGNRGSKLWDTRKLPKGVYLYTLTSAGSSETGKIVISR